MLFIRSVFRKPQEEVIQYQYNDKSKPFRFPFNLGVPPWVRLYATILFVRSLTKRIFAPILHAPCGLRY
ncbi:hypothetical protein EZS27_017096 [termite gut metagenome]|uniref:Uncharacterized protein n=1 Tax=termite gut metagenome TaxID=433724 RepID=A0A5J4RP20_9ZZZZ